MCSNVDVLVGMQRFIEELHAVDTQLDVAAYVVDDAVRNNFPGARSGIPEQLFVREDDDALELALYISPDVVESLARDDPHERLHRGNLESYCIALEGVSHFVFLAWRALRERPVSLLELEIQAEVDKFVAVWLLLTRQGMPRESTARMLVRWMFERYALHDAVTLDEAARYHAASRVARHYCRKLAQDYARDSDPGRLKREIRTFFRKGLAEKILCGYG